jgi:hypothetical protein
MGEFFETAIFEIHAFLAKAKRSFGFGRTCIEILKIW